MKRLFFKLSIYLLRYDLKIKSKYQFKVTVFESNHPQLQIDQELALFDIDVRESKVKAKYNEIIEKAEYQNPLNPNYSFEIDFLKEIHIYLMRMADRIQNGQLSLEYLIVNSGKEIKPTYYMDDGVEFMRLRDGFKDYMMWFNKKDQDLNELLDDEGNPIQFLLKYKVTNTNEIY